MEAIRKFLEETLKNEKIAGMAVAITDREKIIFAEGFGVESIERPEVGVTSKSMFRIASITKVVTGMTILSLAEEGKLSLDTRVKEILPWLTLTDKNTEENVTLRHLLSHTAGLPAEYTPEGPREESALEPSLQAGLPTLEMQFPLGEGYLYSNWGIRLASLVAEKVTGKFFTQLAHERVLQPLGMERTTFDLHLAATYPICLPHTEENGEFRVFHKLQENAARQAAGGLYSNAEDLCRLARCLLNDGEKVLQKASVDEMKTVRGKPKAYDGYGITLFSHNGENGQVYFHPGSAPPYATSLYIHPASGLGIVTLMNTRRNNLRHTIPNTILKMLNKE
ncbi:MAG: beta-lactamase family protein [Oscillospiraceae bacterium]|nr:beta-lactamase family protein [Oscillospiraceae bacterium]